jgi:polysaccharide pyruvyl transferase WcaK-like protein
LLITLRIMPLTGNETGTETQNRYIAVGHEALNGVSVVMSSASQRAVPMSTAKGKKIALFGTFGTGNLGNECTLQAMLFNLRKRLPNAEVSCICAGVDETAATYGIRALAIREMPLRATNNRAWRLLRRICVGIPFELYRWFRVIKGLMGTDMLIMTGTGMLSDCGIAPLGLHYDILRWSVVAKLCRCKLLFVSVGAGPIRHALARFFVKTALRLADYRSYRDSFSKEYLMSIGVDADDDAVYPDLAFSLPESILPHGRDDRDKRAPVGVGLISLSDDGEQTYREYVTKMARFIRWLVEHDRAVQVLTGDIVYDRRVRNDVKTMLEQSGLTHEKSNVTDEPARSFEELLSQLAATTVVVASRFHNLLLALMLGKPTLAISFHKKDDALMTEMGLQEFCQNIATLNVSTLIEQFLRLEKNADRLCQEIMRKTKGYRRELDKQYSCIFEQLSADSVRNL